MSKFLVSRSLLVPMLLIILTAYEAFGQANVTVNGYLRDAADGESLIGATVFVKEINNGAVANVYGFYSLTLPAGTYTLEYSYVGYDKVIKELTLTENLRLDIELEAEKQLLKEVVIEAESDLANVTDIDMSVNKLDIKTIQKLPAFLGEVDVLRSIQLLPGVSTVGEGASGFNVRGGTVGQNLILLDEAPVYNSSHLFGFFSVFNPDAVRDTKLYKGAIPARYGGRIASILDVRMKEGNNKRFSASGGIGTVFSRLTLEGPIVKDKASFILAGRRSYADVFAKAFTSVLNDGAALNFYDLTFKTNYNFSEKDRIYLSGYLGRDNFKFDAQQGFNWGNATGTLRWNHLFNDRLFSNFTGVFSRYDYELAFGEDVTDQFDWNSNITNYILKPEFTYYINSKNEISFGGEAIYYTFEPANAVGVSDSERIDISVEEKYNLETAIYLGNRQEISSRFSLEYGLRFSSFWSFGPGSAYQYKDTIAGVRRPVDSIVRFDRGETIARYTRFEPRFSFKAQISDKSSFKGSYNRTSQYLHLVSNTTAANPLDIWVPSSNNTQPERGDQFTLGYFRNFGVGNDYEASLEGYLRYTDNQIDYIDGADILINEFLEGDLLTGKGRAYGLEAYLRKNTGSLTGWVSYTLGRTELQVDGINNGAWYPTRYDQTHNLKIAAFYDLSPRVSLSGNFTYITGTPTTFPNARYVVQGVLIPHNTGDKRHNVRIEDYHRLDLSLRWEGKRVKKDRMRKNEDYWIFSIYNIYNRRNPFSIYFSQVDDRTPNGTPIQSQATRLSVIGSFIPSISYNFKF